MTTEYVVRTAIGALAYTSSERRLALRFVRLNRDKLPGLTLDAETKKTIVEVQRIWTDRKTDRVAA